MVQHYKLAFHVARLLDLDDRVIETST